MRKAVLAIICAVGLSAHVSAQSITLTEKNGRPLTVGENAIFADGLEVSPLSVTAIVDEFTRICLPDPSGASARAKSSVLQFRPAEVLFPALGKRPEIRIESWGAPTATLSIVPGDNPLMRGLPIVIDERAYQVSGSYGPFRADGDQCNLVLRVGSFADAKALGEALGAKFGPQGKLVIKNTFADGHWQSGNLRINFTAPSTQRDSQPIHLSSQLIDKKAK